MAVFTWVVVEYGTSAVFMAVFTWAVVEYDASAVFMAVVTWTVSGTNTPLDKSVPLTLFCPNHSLSVAKRGLLTDNWVDFVNTDIILWLGII